MYRTDFWTLWEKARVGWPERIALKHVYYQVWNRSPVQVGCMRQVLRAGALGWPRGMGWGGRWEGGSGWGTQVNPWLIHVIVWQKPLQCCKVISLQLIKTNEKKKKKKLNINHLYVQLSAIPWTVVHQGPLSMRLFRQEYWSALPFPSPGDLPDPGIEPGSPTLQEDSLP